MTTSGHRPGPKISARAVKVGFTGAELLNVRLEDGREIAVPLAWFPRLANATETQRQNVRLIGHGVGIHWPDIDEDISVENLLGAEGEWLMASTGTANDASEEPPALSPDQEAAWRRHLESFLLPNDDSPPRA